MAHATARKAVDIGSIPILTSTFHARNAMTIALDRDPPERLFLRLSTGDRECRTKIVRLRRLVNHAFVRTITILQWRLLLEGSSQVKRRLFNSIRRDGGSGSSKPE
jgi:hypothetical protein